MKRDPRLRDLSDDHHQALVLARHAAVAATGDEAAAARAWDEVVRRFERELEPHFAIEERYLLPALETGAHAPLAARTRDEHDALRRLVASDDEAVTARLAKFGAALREHVRFEERSLFPAIQDAVSDAVLEAVAAACRGLGRAPPEPRPTIAVKRVYEAPEPSDGRRLLVDRLWPRGLSKQAAALDGWVRDVAPSAELRRWFNHDPARWTEFKRRYFEELAERHQAVDALVATGAGGTVTLVFSAKDVVHNNAVALAEYLEMLASLGPRAS